MTAILAYSDSKKKFNRLLNYTQNNYKQSNIEVLNQLASHMEILNQSALLSITDLKGTIIHVNDLFCSTSKFSFDEILNNSHQIIRHPDTEPSIFIDMENTLKNGKTWKGEIKNKAKDGSDYWVIATITPIAGPDGKPVKHISIEYDITKQKQAEEELKEAKKKIDNELMENLAYAKHIHSSLLGTKEMLDLDYDSFLIYKAQKIISGDFYKVEQKGNKLMIVIGDSTGHGISASYISLLALNILSRVTRFCYENPKKVLKIINHQLSKITHGNKEKQLTESADMIVCSIDTKLMKLTYVSAGIRAFIVRDENIIILDRDRCSIGAIEEANFSLENKTLDLKKGDCLYIASDGLSDQLGGKRDRCIGSKYVRDLIKKLTGLPMAEQKTLIENQLRQWQGENEQTDDITVFGIRI